MNQNPMVFCCIIIEVESEPEKSFWVGIRIKIGIKTAVSGLGIEDTRIVPSQLVSTALLIAAPISNVTLSGT